VPCSRGCWKELLRPQLLYRSFLTQRHQLVADINVCNMGSAPFVSLVSRAGAIVSGPGPQSNPLFTVCSQSHDTAGIISPDHLPVA
jgi:hypothetical protein